MARTIGHDTLLCAQVGLAGTTDVGSNVILAGQVGVAGHVKIGDGAIAIAQSGIPQDVPAGAMVSGYARHRSQIVVEILRGVQRSCRRLPRR